MRFLLVCSFLAFAPAAAADSMRCGDRLVRTGAFAGDVLAACGEPNYSDRAFVPPDYIDEEEQWHYDFGPQRFVQALRFRRGRLIAIESGGYGSDEPARPAVSSFDN
jgi:hypothetical protein